MTRRREDTNIVFMIRIVKMWMLMMTLTIVQTSKLTSGARDKHFVTTRLSSYVKIDFVKMTDQ